MQTAAPLTVMTKLTLPETKASSAAVGTPALQFSGRNQLLDGAGPFHEVTIAEAQLARMNRRMKRIFY